MKQRKTPKPKDIAAEACQHAGHQHSGSGCRPVPDPEALERASRFFRAMGDTPRLRILHYLAAGECCVTELVEDLHEKFSTISQRLRILRTENLISRRRVGLHVYYALADRHVAELLANALAHAGEFNGSKSQTFTRGPQKAPDHSEE